MPKKFVLTGGPCTGKTATLQALGKKGYVVSGEAARFVIRREQAKGSRLLPWADRDGFQKAVLRRQLDVESRVKKDAFLDRGVPDGLVYYRLDGIPPPKKLTEASESHRYDKVFVLDILPDYSKDSARREDQETGKRIHQLVKEVYTELGYDIVEVPVMSIKERVRFILERV